MVITDRYRQKQTRARRRAEQIRASRESRAKKTPDRRGPKQIAELGSQIPTLLTA
jgi:hypothetical protein